MTRREALMGKGAKLLHWWKQQHVSYYGGKYSIHRLFALESYTRRTSLLRALLVCIGTSLPTTILICFLESLPLRDPTDGWQANYSFWIRVGIVTYLIAQASTAEAVYFIENFTISARQLFLLAAGVSIPFTGCAILIAAFLIFPLPFFVLAMTPIFIIFHNISCRVILGAPMMRQVLAQLGQLVKYLNFLHAQIMMMFVYPAYEVLFRFTEGSQYQLPVVLLLPVLKVLIKGIVVRCTMHIEDLTPQLVIFTVDFFNAIFLATCMQSASSVFVICAITLLELLQTAAMLYTLHRRTATVLSRLYESADSVPATANLLYALTSLCRDTERLGTQFRGSINAYSSFPHPLLAEDARILDTWSSSVRTSPAVADVRAQESVKKPSNRFICFRKRSDVIHPVQTISTLMPVPSVEALQPAEQSTVLRDSLEVFFTIECLVVTAYLEVYMPFFYTTYILVMARLPSAPYHSEMAGVTLENVGSTVLPVLLFGQLQVVSLGLLLAVIYRNCKMQGVYQLAFVLETHMWSIQSKLMAWTMITLCFRLAHFGVDFTFKFDKLGW